MVLVFQPAEEGIGGAKKMVEAGAVENVDAIFGLHVSVDFPIGSVASRSGPILAGSGFFEAIISGKGGHAAIPQHTIDPILAASTVIVSLQQLVSREADPLDSQVLSLSLIFKNISIFSFLMDQQLQLYKTYNLHCSFCFLFCQNFLNLPVRHRS